MSFAFVSTKEEERGPELVHEASTVMRRCTRCREHAVAGYRCEEEGCDYQDVDPDDQLTGPGEGKCEPTEATE